MVYVLMLSSLHCHILFCCFITPWLLTHSALAVGTYSASMNEELEPVLQELWDMVQEALKFRKPGAENQGRSAHCFKSKAQRPPALSDEGQGRQHINGKNRELSLWRKWRICLRTKSLESQFLVLIFGMLVVCTTAHMRRQRAPCMNVLFFYFVGPGGQSWQHLPLPSKPSS